MADYILAFIIPVTIGVLALGILMLTGHRSYPDLKTLIASVLIQSAGYEAATLLIRSFANLYLWESNSIPLAALISVSAVTTLAVTLSVISKDNKTCRLLKIAGYSAFVILMAECLIFNLKSFSANKDHLIAKEVPLTGIASLEEDKTEKFILSEDRIYIKGKTYLVYSGLPGTVRYVSVNLTRDENKDNRPFTIAAEIKDSSMSEAYMTVGKKNTFGYSGRTDFAVKPARSGFDLGISIDPAKNSDEAYNSSPDIEDNTCPLVILSVSLWNSAPYDFMFSRMIILWIITVGIAAIYILKLYKIRYDREKTSHRVIIELIVFATVACAFTVQGPDKNIISYPLTEPVEDYDVYIQTFDAFEKGQLNIDVEAPAELALLNNPYDNSERNAAGIKFLWDRAYYNGKYYSYFGAAPIFTDYYPIYFMTGHVPTCDTVIAINGTIATLFLALALLAVIRIYCPEAKLLLVIALIICCSGLSYLPLLMNFGLMYIVACVSALCFLSISLWSGFTATVTKGIGKYFLFALSAITLGLCAGSRPTVALAGALLIPHFISILIDRKQKISSRISQAASFVLPLALITGALLFYNFARFDDPLTFGSNYQITGSDVNNLKLSLSLLPISVYYYFLIPAEQTDVFPYFNVTNTINWNSEQYHYTIINLGLFFFPLILLAYIMLIPELLGKKDKYLLLKDKGISMIEHKAVLLIAFIIPVFICWIAYCLGGACFRYTSDLTIPIMAGSVMLLTQCSHKNRLQYVITLTAAGISTCLVWLLVIYFDGGTWIPGGDNFRISFPYAIEYVEKLIAFWR
ncbi:MAG: hypothetical protein J5778_04065 [Clostridiales bacterium]|nr:hypothetical protein [Clostridiales bacterium]